MNRLATVVVMIAFISIMPQIAHSAKWYGGSRALVIGIDAYSEKNGYGRLNYAVRDADAIERILRAKKFKVTKLINGAASKKGILDALDDLANKLKKNDRFVIFYSGHGTSESYPVPLGYLAPYKARQNAFSATHLSMSFLRDYLRDRIRAKHVLLILDCCYAGHALRVYKSSSRAIGFHVDDLLSNPALQVLSAGGRLEKAQERNDHGVFTKELINSFYEADYNNDGILLPSEMHLYVKPKVLEKTEAAQSPVFGWYKGTGQLMFKSSIRPKKEKVLPATKGKLSFIFGDTVSVHLDGHYITTVKPGKKYELEDVVAGKHEITAYRSGAKVFSKKVTIAEGGKEFIEVSRLPQATHSEASTWRSSTLSEMLPLDHPEDVFPVSKDSEFLHVAIGQYYPPMFNAKNGEPVGLDIDLIRAVAKKIGKKGVKFVKYGTINAILNGKADIGIGAVTVTPSRLKLVGFSYPYFASYLNVLVNSKENYSVRTNYSKERLAWWDNLYFNSAMFRNNLIRSKGLKFTSKKGAEQAVKDGRADFLLNDYIYLRGLVSRDKAFKVVDKRFRAFDESNPKYKKYVRKCKEQWKRYALGVKQNVLTGKSLDYCAIVLPKNNKKLDELVSRAIIELEQEGVIKRLQEQWLQLKK